ncbi:glycosyltransferase family 39 protein [Candidatus Roizmanbacteria bacterium]|nr:glycosyltransferase family 39 protein [Candidatus Roizmanbacteria bacterium]
MNRNYILAAILVIGFLVRVYRIDNPIADWHSWRQADTAAVTRNFYRFGFTPLTPRYDDLSNIQTGQDNPEGYRFVEFPVYNIVVYAVSNALHFLPVSLEVWHRVVSILFSLGSIYLVYLLGKRFANEQAGLIAAALLSVLPYSVYYSRVILPEVPLVFFILLSLYLFDRAVDNRRIQHGMFILSAAAAGVALLIKPVAIFFLLPVVYIWIRHSLFSKKQLLLGLLYVLLVFLPLVWWRVWMEQYPEGIPAWEWLFNGKSLKLAEGDNSFLKNIPRVADFLLGYEDGGIRYRPAFFYWLIWKRLTELILGYAGVLLVIAGGFALLKKELKHRWFFITLAAGALCYMIVFAEGNVRHDYYQIVTIPALVFILGIGADFVIRIAQKKNLKWVGFAAVAIIAAVSIGYSWKIIQTYYWVNNQAIVEAGTRANDLLPEDAHVIAPYGGDTAFLYQINRQGWPIGFEIEDKIAKGATAYVSIYPDDPETLDLKKRYTVLEETDSYVIIQLR